MIRKNTTSITPALIALVAGFLILPNLAGQYLWQDEAQTALVAKTILVKAVPMVTDGINSFSQEIGAEAGSDGIFKWHPWASFYLVALFFKLFGVSTFSARLPFALFGIATVLLTYFLAARFTGSRRTALIAALLLTISVPFLILSRQCRYYSLLMFFNLLGLYGYLWFIDKRRATMLVGATVVLFYTQNLYFFILWLTVLTHAALYYRDRMRSLIASASIAFALCLPWLIYIHDIRYRHIYSYILTWHQFFDFLPSYFTALSTQVIHWLIIPVCAATLLVKKVRETVVRSFWDKKNFLALLAIHIGISVLALSFASVAPLFRYLAPLLPIMSLVCGLFVAEVSEASIGAGAIIAAVIVALQPLPSYFQELTKKINGPVEGITAYLNTHAKTTDVVAITYDDLPLKFYTPFRVIGGLTGEDPALVQNARWIIVRKNLVSNYEVPLRNYIVDRLDERNYERIEVDAPDTMYENREDPEHHIYATKEDADRVVIYRKIQK